MYGNKNTRFRKNDLHAIFVYFLLHVLPCDFLHAVFQQWCKEGNVVEICKESRSVIIQYEEVVNYRRNDACKAQEIKEKETCCRFSLL